MDHVDDHESILMRYLAHISRQGERLDNLAHHYYGDAAGYERILDANTSLRGRVILPAGLAIRIPVINAAPPTISDLPPWLR